MDDAPSKLNIGQALSGMFNILRMRAPAMIGVILACAVIGAGLDMVAKNGNLSNFLVLFVTIFATHAALKQRFGEDADIQPHTARVLGINILSSLAIVLGLILLIVPGVMLFTRWALAVPAMMTEDLGVTESLGRSKDLTEGNRWAILGLGLVIWVPFLLLCALVGVLSVVFLGAGGEGTFGVNLVLNGLGALVAVLSAILWSECYIQLSGATVREKLVEVFA